MHGAAARRVGHTDMPDETGEISGLCFSLASGAEVVMIFV